jgi:hypothetical protein
MIFVKCQTNYCITIGQMQRHTQDKVLYIIGFYGFEWSVDPGIIALELHRNGTGHTIAVQFRCTA